MNKEIAIAALKKYFGYDGFLPNQWEVIDAIYQGQNALVIMPTGGGKSICYQIPGITLPGICLVVSPLISLMKDQVGALQANGIAAAFLNSSQSVAEQSKIEDALFHQKIQLLYVSPEKLLSSQFLPFLKRLKINLFAIDEAHCISSWGHDFRPEYTQLHFISKYFPDIPIVALTATADKTTRDDIITQLQLGEPRQFIASFDRPNLQIQVQKGLGRMTQIIEFLRGREGQSGIIYCLSRKQTEKLSSTLNANGFNTDFYHAGLYAKQRERVQEAFQKDETNIICATIAFGMGIDKSNVRFVIHYNLPQNLESYYQEIGRAGRDGSPAETLLFYSLQDVKVSREIIKEAPTETVSVKLAKLERMQQFAESLTCRRKMLLGYFGEALSNDCGNCDVCLSPPTYIDGKIIALKAISAIVRLKEKVSINMLIDVLRGSTKKEIQDKGYHRIKTYGAGKDLSFDAWKFYITQIINLGFINVLYHEYNRLQITEAGMALLLEQSPVMIVQHESKLASNTKSKENKGESSLHRKNAEELFKRLRSLRLDIAKEEGVPPYIIFSDTSLYEMAEKLPMANQDFLKISGVAAKKLNAYGRRFMDEIQKFVQEKASRLTPHLTDTHLETYGLFEEGISVQEIATIRGLKESTIFDHLTTLIENGKELDVQRILSEENRQKIIGELKNVTDNSRLKPIFEALNETIPYHEIRLARALYNKKQLNKQKAD